MDGLGQFRWKDGTVYEGNYKGNLKHGMGKYITPSGKIYEGMWNQGVRHG